MPTQQPESIDSASGIPSFAEIAPVLDRLRELAIEPLDEPHMIQVEGWDNGRFDAKAEHSRGVDAETGEKFHQRVEYDLDREAFVYGSVTWSESGGEIDRIERIIEDYPSPI